jgi:pSer/pThr/pTyr-binding forkhead associated (FHA) protein
MFLPGLYQPPSSVNARSMAPRLLAIAGTLKDSTFSLAQPEFSIGRDPANQLSIADTTVSRRHCVLERTAEGFVVRDLGSRSGTRVNGAPT